MRTFLFLSALVALAFSGPGCVSRSVERELQATGRIVEIERKSWVVEFVGLYSGEFKIDIELLSPVEFKGRRLVLGVQKSEELLVGGRAISSGDTIAFRASKELLAEDNFMPAIFSLLHDTLVVEKGPNKAPDSTASAVTPAAGQPRVPASAASRL
jgi:hypothetical protein